MSPSTMVNRHALSSYQASWPDHERRAAQDPRRARPGRKWRTALVGVLLASAAGVYAYRQLTGPAYDGATEAKTAPLPEDSVGQDIAPPDSVTPLKPPVAVVPEPPPTPRAVRPSRSSSEPAAFEQAFADSSEPVPAVASGPALGTEPLVAAAVIEDSTSSVDLTAEAGAEIGPSAVAVPLPLPLPQVADGTAPDAPASQVSTEGALSGAIVNIDVDPPAPESAAPRWAAGETVPSEVLHTAAETPLAAEDRIDALAEQVDRVEPAVAPPVVLAALDAERPERPMLRARRAIPRRADTPVLSAEPDSVVAPAPAPATAPLQSPPSRTAMERASPAAGYVQHFPMVVLDGAPLGAITVREFAGGRHQIHLGALLSLFKLRMNPVEYERLIGSASADQFVSFEVLSHAGLGVRYDARRGQLVIGSQSGSPAE